MGKVKAEGKNAKCLRGGTILSLVSGEGLIEKVMCEQIFEGGRGRAMRLCKGRDHVLGKGNSKRQGFWGTAGSPLLQEWGG